MGGKLQAIVNSIIGSGWIAGWIAFLGFAAVCYVACYTNFNYSDIDIAFMTIRQRGKKKLTDTGIIFGLFTVMFYGSTGIREVQIYIFLLSVIFIVIWMVCICILMVKSMRTFLIKKRIYSAFQMLVGLSAAMTGMGMSCYVAIAGGNVVDILLVNMGFSILVTFFLQIVFDIYAVKGSKVKIETEKGELFVYYKLEDGKILCGKESVYDMAEDYFAVSWEDVRRITWVGNK